MKRILTTATYYSTYCAQAKALLESKGYEVIENKTATPYLPFEELQKIVPTIDGVIAGLDNWNEEVFKIAKNLKIIARFGVGYDNIDVPKAKEYGIKITNAVGANSNSVAEITVAFMLAVLRNIPELNSIIRSGAWKRFVGYELKGKKVGLVGFGAIGQLVAKKLGGFEAELFAFDAFPNAAKAKELNVTFLGFEELLKTCDIVSLHAPSTAETYHLMSEKQFSMMKQGSYFVNTARGALVDEAALCRALASRHLAAAAIDVYEKEPTQADNQLFKLDNIICTPHTASETYESYTSVSLVTAQAVIDVLEGRTPRNLL